MNRILEALQAEAAEPEVPESDTRPVYGPGDILLSGPQVRAMLGISRWTLDSWIRAGVAPAPVPNLPGHPRWSMEAIERFKRGKHGTTGREYFKAARRGR